MNPKQDPFPEGDGKDLEKGLTMKKSEKINAAKKVAMSVLRNEKPDPKLQKILKEEGCVMTQDGDGFHFVDSDGKGYQFVPKGRFVIQYDRNDWLEYRALAEMLAEKRTKKNAREVAELLGNVRAESLRKKLVEQIEARGVEVEQPKVEKKPKTSKKPTAKTPKNSAKPKAEKPKKQPKPKFESEAVKEFDGKFDGVTFTQKRADACVWATGKTSAHKDALKAAGFRWSRKRQAYFRKPVAA